MKVRDCAPSVGKKEKKLGNGGDAVDLQKILEK